MTENKSEHPSPTEKSRAAPRRRILSAVSVGSLLAGSLRSGIAYAVQPTSEDIQQPEVASDSAFVRQAFEMRRLAVEYGDQAYGAVVVRDGRIIGQSWSRVILDQDPTGHAEMSAIRDAARRVENRDLSGAILYASSRPCSMCEAAASWCGISEMVHGKNATRAGPPQRCA